MVQTNQANLQSNVSNIKTYRYSKKLAPLWTTLIFGVLYNSFLLFCIITKNVNNQLYTWSPSLQNSWIFQFSTWTKFCTFIMRANVEIRLSGRNTLSLKKKEYIQWNAKIWTSQNGKAPKSELLTVWILAHSDFRSLGLLERAKSVQNLNAFG